MRTRRVLFVTYPGMHSLDLTGPLEVFVNANDYPPAGFRGPAYDVATGSLGGLPVRTSSGLQITPDVDLAAVADLDMLVVPGGLQGGLPDPPVIEWLRQHGSRARQLVSVCTGTFLLAEAGLLAGRRVTTHWAKCEQLATEYPDLHVLPEPIFVREGPIATSGGVTAGIDLALALVEEDCGRDTALAVARDMVMFLRRPGDQSQFSVQLATQMAQRRPVRDVQQWIAEHPEADLSLAALAQRASMSPRHFTRAFTAEVGMSPGRYVERVRIEAARRRLEDTRDSIEATARACGYGTPETMRRAFVRALSVSPAEYRRRFQPMHPQLGRHETDSRVPPVSATVGDDRV
ncbi:GlxA family transcriptional regulator [Nocardia sp. NPDC049149]|uniref:GlxA family transcriptional regulator n=1 Tax=Nocardia sp. NPDC049149 TaxID=3364315 RepID=UPI00371A4F0D